MACPTGWRVHVTFVLPIRFYAADTTAADSFLFLDVLGLDNVEVHYTPSLVAKGIIGVWMERVIELWALAGLVKGQEVMIHRGRRQSVGRDWG